jgi:homoserine kinase type II
MAVYTDVSDREIADFTSRYALGRVVACKGIAEGVENSNYLLAMESGTYILTLYEKRVQAADLPFFLGLMEHLAVRGVPCPTPVRGEDGESLRTLAGRPAAIVTFLPGLWPRQPTVAHCAAVGESLARLHQAGADFPRLRANALSLAGWRALLGDCLARREAFASQLAPQLADELEGELALLEATWPHGLTRGIIHADLFPDNVLFEGARLSGIIDFYFACHDLLAYDLAICLNAWCFERDGSFNITKARRMLGAYRARRALSAEEIGALPLLARGAALRFLLTRLYDWMHRRADALVSPKNPAEYLQKLRFHQRIAGPEGYGLE